MDKPLFVEKSRPPTDADLDAALGRARRHWDALVAQVRGPGLAQQWKFYGAKYGWTFVVRDRRRNLMYLKPAQASFTASFALSDSALAAAREADLPASLVAEIAAGPKYPEGRPARIPVRTAADLEVAAALLAIKREG